MASDLYIGLMSGTSLDGVDGVVVDLPQGQGDGAQRLRVLGHTSLPLGEPLRTELLALNRVTDNELHRAALAANALVRRYAEVVQNLLQQCHLPASAVRAIGAHGQTVRHRPQAFDGMGYTLQLNNPALLAELTGIDVVADFRSRDVAAGGQGAPLVPAFHRYIFGSVLGAGSDQAPAKVCVLNLGGMANLTLLDGGGGTGADVKAIGNKSNKSNKSNESDVLGFDCGPGNVLLDMWCQQHTGQPFDLGGAWAASGRVVPELLVQCLTEPYFSLPAPKSTGRDLFHAGWLAPHLAAVQGATMGADLRPSDVQATLTELTAQVCAQPLHDLHGRQTSSNYQGTLIVCGGGALNTYLMQRLAAHLPQWTVQSSTPYGLAPLQVEAAAFAWLAQCRGLRRSANVPRVTGAAGPRILGALYPA